MNRPLVLVTSAAGHTGAIVVKELRARGFPVRALVRRRDARSAELEAHGAELIVGDLFDIRDLRSALKGVQRAYHCPPFGPNLLHGNVLFAIAAEEAGLEMVALMESWNADPHHRSDFIREHWMSQKLVEWMPSVETVHIAPGLFAFAYFLDVMTIRNLGLLLLPLGMARNAPPSNEDIGALVAQVIAEPDDHIGRFYRPTGPELLSPADVAEVCGRILDRRVRYRDVSTRMFTKAARALGLSRFEISHIRHFVEEHRGGAFELLAPNDHVERVIGRPPEAFEDTARRYLEHPELVHRRFKKGGALAALIGMLRVMLTRAPDLEAYEKDRESPIIRDPLLAQESADWRAGLQRFTSDEETGSGRRVVGERQDAAASGS